MNTDGALISWREAARVSGIGRTTLAAIAAEGGLHLVKHPGMLHSMLRRDEVVGLTQPAAPAPVAASDDGMEPLYAGGIWR